MRQCLRSGTVCKTTTGEHTLNILTVTQLNRYISFKLKEDTNLHGIFLRGEISNFKNAGHCYFTLKDNETLIKAVMFKSNAQMLKFRPENGMKVIAMGTVSVFERDGVYQLYVSDMQPDGIGDKHIRLERLKAELQAAGLFDPLHKLSVPEFPKKVGAVTSGKGAALQDMINIISRRYPLCELRVYHSTVQGTEAPKSLRDSLERAQNDGCDVVILGRGGGSSEDLDAFNDRELAYFIYNMTVPVISAVGHETDFTISDLVADLRAPTPSAAAELAVPSQDVLLRRISQYEERIRSAAELQIRRKGDMAAGLSERLQRLSPQAVLEKNIAKVENCTARLASAAEKLTGRKETALVDLAARLGALNPLNVLERGYAAVYSEDGSKIIKSTGQLNVGDRVKIRFADGSVSAAVTETEKN